MRNTKHSLELEGTWRLVSFEIIDPDGNISPWGAQVHGTLIYAPLSKSSGWMSASINRAIEDGDSLDSCLFYSGRYEYLGTELRHFVTEATDPHRIGKTLIRYPVWDGSTLKLKSPTQPWGTAIICWQKV